MLAFRVTDPHGGFDFFLGRDILDAEQFFRLGQVESLCNLVHHFLAGADNQDLVVFFPLQGICNFFLVFGIIEYCSPYSRKYIVFMFRRLAAEDAVSPDQKAVVND